MTFCDDEDVNDKDLKPHARTPRFPQRALDAEAPRQLSDQIGTDLASTRQGTRVALPLLVSQLAYAAETGGPVVQRLRRRRASQACVTPAARYAVDRLERF